MGGVVLIWVGCWNVWSFHTARILWDMSLSRITRFGGKKELLESIAPFEMQIVSSLMKRAIKNKIMQPLWLKYGVSMTGCAHQTKKCPNNCLHVTVAQLIQMCGSVRQPVKLCLLNYCWHRFSAASAVWPQSWLLRTARVLDKNSLLRLSQIRSQELWSRWFWPGMNRRQDDGWCLQLLQRMRNVNSVNYSGNTSA